MHGPLLDATVPLGRQAGIGNRRDDDAGAVAAREYGILAILGVNQATQRLHTVPRIRMDRSSGKIFLLET